MGLIVVVIWGEDLLAECVKAAAVAHVVTLVSRFWDLLARVSHSVESAEHQIAVGYTNAAICRVHISLEAFKLCLATICERWCYHQ